MSIPVIPTATYRLQFGPGFGFRDAEKTLPYLHRLGISHVYASPILKARSGSTHGYDIVDHNALNEELGGEADFEAFVTALHRHEMGLILDFVPNHMGIARADNAWWLDVLEWGEASPYAGYFDIEWRPLKPDLRGKVLLPFLGDHYGAVLERGEIQIRFDPGAGKFAAWYGEHCCPVAPHTYARILAARLESLRETDSAALATVESLTVAFHGVRPSPRAPGRWIAGRAAADALERQLAEAHRSQPEIRAYILSCLEHFNGMAGAAGSFTTLHRLLEVQHWRLAYWRVAGDEVNYRRFFDINELAALSMERPALFETVHRLVLRLVASGKVQGLRIDHVDGLYDPKAYLAKLVDAAQTPIYLIVEKILEGEEALPEDWPVAGTTGYETLALVDGLFVDPGGLHAMDRAYRLFTGISQPFDEFAYEAKKRILDTALAGELAVLASALDRISESNRRSRDFTHAGIADALKEIVAAFPVYRTYITERRRPSAEDRARIDAAFEAAARRRPDIDAGLLGFIRDVVTTDLVRRRRSGYGRRAVVRFAMRLQQFTGPVMAKSLEDTAFYRYHRLIALNEVGNDPRRFGTTPAAAHHANAERQRRHPHAMLASTTHDTKRTEDVRARLVVLSEIPDPWEAAVRSWAALNRDLRPELDGTAVPGPNEEYLLYQTLLGAWPMEMTGAGMPEGEPVAVFRDRIEAYMTKAVREAKTVSSWASPNVEYEAAIGTFLARILDVSRANAFLDAFLPFQARIARAGALNSLCAGVLRLTAPGVPDVYQGSELWSLALVDPDNRRPVDFALRESLLQGLADVSESGRGADDWRDGATKLRVLSGLLALRRRLPALFAEGGYLPLRASGPMDGHIFAFARRQGDRMLVVAVPRLIGKTLWGLDGDRLPPDSWAGTYIETPPLASGHAFMDVWTGDAPADAQSESGARLPAERLFAAHPVSVLLAEPIGLAQS